MVHSVLKNCLKIKRFLAGFLCIISLPLYFIPLAIARSNPSLVLSAPIEIRDTIPQDDAGIVNFARVPDQTTAAFLIRAAYGIDLNAPDAIRFRIDDSYHHPYWRDLRHDAVRVVKLGETPAAQSTYLWAAYDRFLEPFMPTNYPPNAVIQVTVEIRDIRNNILQPAPFEFKIESSSQKAASRKNGPNTAEFYDNEPFFGHSNDAGIAVVDGKLAGAKVFFSRLEPLTPEFGNPDDLEAIRREDMQAVGMPLNLLPHTVFDRPVRLFIPLTEDVDIKTVGLAYHDGTQWLPAADAEGTVLPGGEGWVVPGSRVNHEEASPPLIEVQVYHFSAAQAVVFARFGDTADTTAENKRSHGTNASVFISCFINSVSADASFEFAGFIGLIGLVSCLLLVRGLTKLSGVGFQVSAFNP